MKKNSSKSTSAISSKSSFGNARNASNVSFNKFNSANGSLSGGSAFGKATSFKRSVSVGAGYSFSCDKKPLSSCNDYKANKPKNDKILTAGIKSSPDIWKGNSAKYEKNGGSKSCSESNWISFNPKFEKSTNTNSKRETNPYFGSTTSNYKNSATIGSQFSTENCKPSLKYEKIYNESCRLQSSLPSKNTAKTTQKSAVYSNSSNKGKIEKSAQMNSYNKGLLEKSNAGFLAPSALSSSSLGSEKSKIINYGQSETNISNKATKDCNSGLHSSLEFSSKRKAQTSSYFDAVSTSHVKNGFLNDSNNSANKDSKNRRHSGENAPKASNPSGKTSQNDHHFYNNLSKLFHLKGSSHGQLKTSHITTPTYQASKQTSLCGTPSINLVSTNPKRTLDFKTPESVFKETTVKDYKLKDDSKKEAHSSNSLNFNYEVPSPASRCTKVTVFPSVVSDLSNQYRDAPNISGSPLSLPSDNHARKINHGISFNKNIFGHLFVKHSGDKKVKNSEDSFCQDLTTSVGLKPINPQPLKAEIEGNDFNSRVNPRQKEPNFCVLEAQKMSFCGSEAQKMSFCGSEAQKMSFCGSDCGSKPLRPNQVSNGNKPSSIKEAQSLIHAGKDQQRIFHNEEKTKVIAELLKSYCMQQRKEVCLQNGLKPVQKTTMGSNNHPKVTIGIDRNNVDCMSIAHPASRNVANHVAETATINTPVSSVNPSLKLQSAITTASKNSKIIFPTPTSNLGSKTSCKESIKPASNINCTSFNHLDTNIQLNSISAENQFNTEASSAISATENGYFVQLPESFSQQCKGVRKKVGTHAETLSSSPINADELKNGHLQLFKSSNILSSFSNLTHAISTGPLKKSSREQQRSSSKKNVGEASASMSHSAGDKFIHGGIIPSLDVGNHHTSNCQKSLSSQNTRKCTKQKQSSDVEMRRNHSFPFMIDSRGHHVPISTHARDAILSALMFSTVNRNRKKVSRKQQRCARANNFGNQQFGCNQNSIGLSAIGLALPRASSQPNPLETQREESDDSDDPLPETPPFVLPCPNSDYFNGRSLESHTVDDFRSSYDKVTQVINHGKELLAAGNYFHACVEFEVGLKLMDCILESKIDDSDMSPLDKTICKSVQEVIRVDRKSALEGFCDAQAGYAAPQQESSQQLPDRAPSAPPSYTDVLREDLEKNFFSCGVHCMDVNQQNAREQPLPGSDFPSAPCEDLSKVLLSLPPSYELQESASDGKIEAASGRNLNSKPNPSSSLNTVSPDGEIQRASSCDKIIEKEQSLIKETQFCENCTLKEKGSVNSDYFENQNCSEKTNSTVKAPASNVSAACQQSTCQVLTNSLSVATNAVKNCNSRFTVCPCNLNTNKTESINLQTLSDSCKATEPGSRTHDDKDLSKNLYPKLEGFKECNDSNVSGSLTKNVSTVDEKQLNEKENQPNLILNNEHKEVNLENEISENGSPIRSTSSLPSKTVNGLGCGSSEAKTLAEKHLASGKLPSSAPPPPNGQLPPLPSIVPSPKRLTFPPDVEVFKQNNSDSDNLKSLESKSELTKAIYNTEIENIYFDLKACHNGIKVRNVPVLGGKFDEGSVGNTSSVKEDENTNQVLECEEKVVRPANETGPCLNDAKHIFSDRTIVLDPFLFEDPFPDSCFDCRLQEEEPFCYDDENVNFSLQENSTNDFGTIFAPVSNLDRLIDNQRLVSGFAKEELTKRQNNAAAMEVKGKEYSRISNPCYYNLEASQSREKFPATADFVTFLSRKSSSELSSDTTTSDTNWCETPKLIINMNYETNNISINHTDNRNGNIASINSNGGVAHESEVCLNETESLIQSEKSSKGATTDKFLARKINPHQITESGDDKSTISSSLENSRKAISQEGFLPWNSKHKVDPIYQNVSLETTGLERIYPEVCDLPTRRTVDDKQSSDVKSGDSCHATTVSGLKPEMASKVNKGSSSKPFNSRSEMNTKKGFKSFSVPSFLFSKNSRQSSDEGRLIGQSSFFTDVENTKEGGGGGITLLKLEDVRVYFMDSTENISSPSINQTINICQSLEKTHLEGPVCLEIGKKLWFKYLNVASTKTLKTIEEVYIIEENSDSYFAIQLSSKTKFSIIDQFEDILKKNSNYQTEVLAKHQKEYRKITNKMESFIKKKSPAFYFQAHDLSRKSMRAVQNAAASISKGFMNFQSSKQAIRDSPSTSPMTLKLNGQMEILQIKGRLLEEAQWKNSIVFI